MAERRRDTEWSHPPLEPCALALLQEGPWYGAAPTGYKLMRRVSQKQKGSALDLLNKRNGNFNGKRGDQKERTTQLHLQRNGRTPLLLGARFRRQPLAPSGATLRAPGVDRSARPSKEACRAIKCRTALARASRNGKEEMLIAKTLLDTRAPHISWIKNRRSWSVSPTRPCSLRLKMIN
jgi:hypothetical protein